MFWVTAVFGTDEYILDKDLQENKVACPGILPQIPRKLKHVFFINNIYSGLK